ncbi:MAG: hypothetical protein OXN23_07235 [Gammaproteobacteria bacterium]|nr:hypothetical protein [Gammaproteobacteria bacterium]
MTMQRNHWRIVFVALVLAWCTTIGLFLSGVLTYPVGWLVLMALAGWAWYKMRESR